MLPVDRWRGHVADVIVKRDTKLGTRRRFFFLYHVCTKPFYLNGMLCPLCDSLLLMDFVFFFIFIVSYHIEKLADFSTVDIPTTFFQSSLMRHSGITMRFVSFERTKIDQRVQNCLFFNHESID